MNERIKPSRRPRQYDWHHQDQDLPTYVGIYRIVNANLHLFEEDFIQLALGDDDQHNEMVIDRVVFVCELLNEGLITERQANDIFLLLKLKGQRHGCTES